jgi:GDPmannose 4,6-dehydratase
MTTTLVLGVTGQDGQILSDKLIKEDHLVIGIARNIPNWSSNPLNLIRPKVLQGDILDSNFMLGIIKTYNPSTIYNLAGESSVAKSFLNPVGTLDVNSLGVLNILESIKKLKMGNKIKIFQASSSEMFGNSSSSLSENSSVNPISPYAISKYLAHKICIRYRDEYGFFISNGILFNHESELHDSHFVFQKVIRGLIKVSRGQATKIKLGNLEIERDWGYAPEYIDAMVKIMQTDSPSDYVIATGQSYSLKFLIEEVKVQLGIKRNIDEIVELDLGLIRPTEVTKTCGNPAKIKCELNWSASIDFRQLVKKIIEFNLKV